MARAVHDGPHPDYECKVEPDGSRWRWTAYRRVWGERDGLGGLMLQVVASGRSRWHWRATRKAEDACRTHLLDAQVARAHEAREAVQRWAPVL